VELKGANNVRAGTNPELPKNAHANHCQPISANRFAWLCGVHNPNNCHYNDPLKFAFVFIVLASGILGALAQFTASREMTSVAADLGALENPSRTAKGITQWAQLYWIPMLVTPAIFLVIFISLTAGLIS